MAKKRRRRRDERRGDLAHTEAAQHRPTHEEREAGRLRAAFTQSQRKTARRRTVVGALGFIPLAATFVPCGSAGPFDLICAIDRQWWLLIWAAIFGSFLGLTIRLVLERRRFARGTWRARA